MSDINLGTLLTEGQERDAVHFAIACVFSDEILLPGQHIGLVKGSTVKVESALGFGIDNAIGIVDPFLTKPVPACRMFWMMLYQKTVTGMRHAWDHPSFPTQKSVIKEIEARISKAPLVPNPKEVRKLPEMTMEFPEGYTSEKWLRDFCASADCPGFDEVMQKATEIADGASGSDWSDEAMHFNGSGASGPIPDEFWTHVERYLGRTIKGRKASYFSCSC